MLILDEPPYHTDDIPEADELVYTNDDIHHMDKLNHGDNIYDTDDSDIMCSFNVHINVEGTNILTEEDMSVESWRRRPKNI
jgi:hypothetical protein